MINTETYYNSKKGRPAKAIHECLVCKHTFLNAQSLASHTNKAKFQKIKCVVPSFSNDEFTPPQQIISTSIGPKSMFNHPLASLAQKVVEGSPERQQPSSTSASTTIDLMQKNLMLTNEWKKVKDICGTQTFDQITNMNKNFALSFMLQTHSIEDYPKSYLSALIKAFKALGKKLPAAIPQLFVQFVENFDPLSYDTQLLKDFFEFTKQIPCSCKWLTRVADLNPLLVDPSTLTLNESALIVEEFLQQSSLFSHSYFEVFQNVMEKNMYQKFFAQFIEEFFQYIYISNDKSFTTDFMLEYGRVRREHKLISVNDEAQNILKISKNPLSNCELLELTELKLKKGQSFVVKVLQSRLQSEELSSTIGRIADILEEEQLKQEKETKAFQLQQEAETKKKAAEDEAKQLFAEQEQLKLKQFEEERKRQELEEEIRQTNISSTYYSYCQHNNMIADDVKFLEFVEQIQTISAELPTPIAPRPIQLAILFGLATSQHITTLMQLPTGWGKSYMFGMLARYLNLILGKKVAVVVPNETLAAIQQDLFSPWANRAQIDLTKVEAITINYCTYDDFLSGNIPTNTLCLVDELDSLFFSDSPLIKGDRFLSAIILLNKYQIVGMSATFRGHQGTDFILRFLHGSIVQSAGDAATERKLQLDVYGKLNAAEIKGKVMELVKIKQAEIPVVIILPSITICEEYESLMENCWIFGRGNVPEQLSCLRQLKKFTASPWPVVLTTSIACLGHDLTATAFVIQTELPSSWAVFLQNMGRGNRVDPNAVLYGALVTQSAVFDQESIKQGCEYQQQRANLFRYDYFDCLQYLECCSLVDSSLLTFKQAFKLFQKGATAHELRKMLSKVHKFKVALEVSGLTVQPITADTNKFKVPMSASKKTEVFGKRLTTGKASTLDNFLQSPTKKQTTGDDEYSFSEEGKWFAAQGQEYQEMINHDEVGMHPDASIMYQPAGGLSEAVVEDLERQQYQALHVKFGGQQACLGTASPQSKTSSVILFGKEEDTAGIIRRKREQKQREKESVKSGESKYSKRSMKKDTAIVDESQWKKLAEKDKHRHFLQQCQNNGCQFKCQKGDRWKHVCTTK